MLQRNHRAWLEIDLAAIEQNTRSVKQLLNPKTAIMAVVKADAYGHGAINVAIATLKGGASWLGVATIEEGIELRNGGIAAPILVLGATTTIEEAHALLEYRLQPTLSNLEQADICQRAALKVGATLAVHLKLDTGMSRLGMPWEEGKEFIRSVESCPQLSIQGLCSHLATADEPNSAIIKIQHDRFEQVLEQVSTQFPHIHLCNSAAALLGEGMHYTMVRVGLALYGFLPAPHLAGKVTLKPAMAVKARITQLKSIKQNTGVSYGHRFHAPQPMTIGIVSIGYADGLPRGLSDRVTFRLHDQAVKQIGIITMDQCMIDVTHVPATQVGDVVTLLDSTPGYTAADWATQLNTITWEVLCSFKHRLPRISC